MGVLVQKPVHEVVLDLDRQLDSSESSVDQYTIPNAVKLCGITQYLQVCGITMIHLPVTVTHFCSGIKDTLGMQICSLSTV